MDEDGDEVRDGAGDKVEDVRCEEERNWKGGRVWGIFLPFVLSI